MAGKGKFVPLLHPMIMAFSEPEHPASRGSTGSRIGFAIAGVVALAVGTVITVGGALIGIVAISITWFLARRRGHRITLLRAWVVSFGATAGVLVLFLLVTFVADPSTRNLAPDDRAAARARARDSMPDWLKQMAGPSPQQNAAADSLAQKVIQNKGVMLWLAMMGAVLGSSILGGMVGTVAWAVMLLFYRASEGEWPRGETAEPATGGM